MNKRHLARAAGAAGLLALVGAGAYRTLAPRPAPDVMFTRLDGSRSRIGDLRGQVVLVNFWATTCAVCVKDMPQVVATHERFRARGFETLAVAMPYDPPASVVRFTESRRLPFPVVIDLSGEVSRAFGDVQVTPTHVLIDRQGRIVEQGQGALQLAALHRRIEGLLDAA